MISVVSPALAVVYGGGCVAVDERVDDGKAEAGHVLGRRWVLMFVEATDCRRVLGAALRSS